ncbi:CocE/NonD family hydrolase [Christensenellaceae bacterium NSJ-44]|uniref:CocE/NonD family hydrolase n=1 Tax=Luoshenia tenuis TaxID=2763654 RepID=A0A926D0N1_9FIRM|nr:CocE/NonD family hydrolase [Luoshenia tenuis]MBC8529374.1 CocE/NonD family hydrolase [Luoshenia tenuis]
MSKASQRLAVLRQLYRSATPAPTTRLARREELLLPMADRVELRTVFFFPAEREQAPIVLQRCCYPGMAQELEIHGEEYAKRGFIFVLQWCRGTGGSQGEWEPNVNERADGLTTLHYLAAQPYTDGIGYWGNSYLALTGWCMADALPPQVKSMYLGVYGTDRHTSAYQDGLFRQDILTAWAQENAGVPIASNMMDSYRYRPQLHVDEALWGVSLPWYRDWISHTDRSDPYWSQGFWKMLKDIPGKVNIPVFIREGWYDHHLGSALVTYQDLSPQAKAHSILQIGPWNHGYGLALTHHKAERLADDSVQSPLAWFEETLLQKRLPQKAVQLYAIGADRWETWPDFPVRARQIQHFYLDAGATQDGAHALLPLPPEAQAQASYVYDPEDPVPSHGAESLFHTREEIGSLPQPACGYRADVVSFLSASTAQAFEINGKLNARLFVASSAEDTAFTAKVMEVFADGTTVNIRGGITTLAYRNGASQRGSYTPGTVVEVNITLWDIAWLVQPGSRIRLDIASSDFPQYAVHSNYPGVWACQARTRPATQRIFTGGAYPSVLEIPCATPD